MLRRLQARYMVIDMVTASGERSLVTLARDNLEWRKMKKKTLRTELEVLPLQPSEVLSFV